MTSSIPDAFLALDTTVILALLIFAAWRDVLTRTIPDYVSIALIGAGCLTRSFDGWGAVVTSLLVGVGVFIVLLPACSRGLLGGADLKLLASLAIGLPPVATLHVIAAVTISGGALAAIYVGLNRFIVARAARRSTRGWAGSPRARLTWSRLAIVECWRIRRSAPLPYGIAIAIGAAIVVLNRQGV